MSDPRERLFRKSDKALAKECGVALEDDADEVRNFSVTANRPPARAGATPDPRIENNRIRGDIYARHEAVQEFECAGHSHADSMVAESGKFAARHPEIVGSERLTAISRSMDKQMLAAGDDRSAHLRYQEIAERVGALAKDASLDQAIDNFGVDRVAEAGVLARFEVSQDLAEELDRANAIREMMEKRGR
jgi:hypothetical protein